MTETRNARRLLQGVVVGTKPEKTITVVCERTYKHRRYGKYIRKKKKYLVHDPAGAAVEGDLVEIAATRPISKHKRWRLVRVLVHSELATVAHADVELDEEPEGEAR